MRHLLLISIVIGIVALVCRVSENAFFYLFALPTSLLVLAAPAVFAVEAVSDWRSRWTRIAGTIAIAAAIAVAFTILGVSWLWPGVVFALFVSLFLEWRRSHAQPEP